jgi:hypothetical protein
MKKSKVKKKTDDIRVFEATYLAAINSNLELTKENQVLTDELERLKRSNTTTKRENKKYLIELQMYSNLREQVYDFTDIIQIIQFESPELLVKLLRQIHHNYSILNINEMTMALNKKELSCCTYSESVPNELHILKTLIDCIEGIKEVNTFIKQ